MQRFRLFPINLKVALFYDWLNQWGWRITNNGYVSRSFCTNGIVKKRLMHRLIMNPKDLCPIDHINGNPLDNRRSNLRICVSAQNIQNKKSQKNNTSGCKGVYWHKGMKRWAAEIVARRVKYRLGFYHNIKDAALAYDLAANRYHGEFARTNKMLGLI